MGPSVANVDDVQASRLESLMLIAHVQRSSSFKLGVSVTGHVFAFKRIHSGTCG